jgi:hypothetical protein
MRLSDLGKLARIIHNDIVAKKTAPDESAQKTYSPPETGYNAGAAKEKSQYKSSDYRGGKKVGA